MDTTIKCCNCDREMGLTEFLTYPEAYLMKLIIPLVVPFIVTAIANELASRTNESVGGATRGVIDNGMAGLAKNFSISCPNCGKINWCPASGLKPKKVKDKSKSKQAVV